MFWALKHGNVMMLRTLVRHFEANYPDERHRMQTAVARSLGRVSTSEDALTYLKGEGLIAR